MRAAIACAAASLLCRVSTSWCAVEWAHSEVENLATRAQCIARTAQWHRRVEWVANRLGCKRDDADSNEKKTEPEVPVTWEDASHWFDGVCVVTITVLLVVGCMVFAVNVTNGKVAD